MGKKILVIGDAMLDSYHFGDVRRISPEAPVPVFLEVGKKKYSPGGAANVAINIAAIGMDTTLFAIAGNDDYGKILKEQLEKSGISTEYLQVRDDYRTISKLRYIGPGNQQILRVDTEDTTPEKISVLEGLFDKLEKEIDQYHLIVVSDYLKGLLTEEITQRIIQLGVKRKIQVIVDVKDKNISKYKKATILKPNRKELAELSGCNTDTLDFAILAAMKLCKQAECKYVLATLGADGMILVNENGLIRRIKSMAREVFDVTGAGDTSIAYLAAELVKGTDIERAMIISNYAAGVQVSKVGTSIVYPEEVCAAMQEDGRSKTAGILNYYTDGGLEPIARAKAQGRKIVFTNGCFDILHVGHITYLRKAKSLGDILVVGVNSDDSVKRLKGESRPINTCEDRMVLLSSLDFVDYVVEFKEDTPAGLIEKIIPDVLVKGGDYKPEEIAGADFVLANGGEVKILDFVEGKSTTSIVEKMKRS